MPPAGLAFDDPLEGRIAWWPASHGGTRSRVLRLVVRRGRLDLQTSPWVRMFATVLSIPGLAVIGLLAWRGDRLNLREILLLGFFAAGWLALAAVSFWAYPAVAFDRRRAEVTRAPFLGRVTRVPFDELHALQVLREACSSHGNTFYSYELNLVLHSGRRVNVADHGDLAYLRENARRLRAFLGVPIWDAADADAPPRPPSRRDPRAAAVRWFALAVLMAGAAWIAAQMSLSRASYLPGLIGTIEWLASVLEVGLWAGLTGLALWRGRRLLRQPRRGPRG